MLPKVSDVISKYGPCTIIDKEEKKPANFHPSDKPKMGACVILKDRENKLVLIRQNPSHSDIDPEHWSFACGKNEANETLEETAVREACEELGVKVEVKGVHHIGHHFVTIGGVRHSIYYGVAFFADLISGSPRINSIEVQEVKAFSRLPSNFFPKHRKYYPDLC